MVRPDDGAYARHRYPQKHGRDAARHEGEADAVVIAVGSRRNPDIPGIDSPNVFAADVDTGRARVGKRAVLIGAGLTGTETAVVLARDGHEVTLIDMLTLGDRQPGRRCCVVNFLRRMSDEAGVKVMTGLKAKEIKNDASSRRTRTAGLSRSCESAYVHGRQAAGKPCQGVRGCAEDVM